MDDSKQLGVRPAAEQNEVPPSCLVEWLKHEKGGTGVERDLQQWQRLPNVFQICEKEGKTNEASMLRIVNETVLARWKAPAADRVLYLVDGAPSHMHSSVARALERLNFALYISPPNSTPFSQACKWKE